MLSLDSLRAPAARLWQASRIARSVAGSGAGVGAVRQRGVHVARIRKRGGVYQAMYYDANGKRRWKTTHCTDARAANAAARQLELKAHDPTAAAAANTTTLSDALAAMLAHVAELVKAGRKAQATLEFHRDKAASLVFAFESEGPFRLARLTAGDVDRFISQRRSDGASENTIAKELVTLRQALKLAVRSGDWSGDPRAILPVAFAPDYKPRERFIEPDELNVLLGRLTEDHAARLAFEVATSANLGEAERAQRADVIQQNGKPVAVCIRGTKRATRARTVPVVTDWQRLLISYAAEHGQGQAGALFRYHSAYHNALRRACATCSACGRKIVGKRPCTATKGMQECQGLPHVSPNDLRRTYCHWMRQEGMPRELVASAMGHGSTAMVDKVYGKLTATELSALMTRALGGTPVAQSHAFRMDLADLADTAGGGKMAENKGKMVGREGIEPSANGLKVRFLKLASPRKHRENRQSRQATGTPVAQRKAGTGLSGRRTRGAR
jgi:integrase